MGRARKFVVLGILFAAVGGCSSEVRERVVAFLFEPPPKEGPAAEAPRRNPRRPAERKAPEEPPPVAAPAPPTQEERPIGETLKLWVETQHLFPKDRSGGIDWVAAIKEGAIVPRRTLDGSPEEPQEAIPDFELVPENERQFAVTFSHDVHLRWLKCVNCHPDPFPGRRAGTAQITMAKIFQGEFCGRCHGKVAFDMSTGCLRCHRKLLE